MIININKEYLDHASCVIKSHDFALHEIAVIEGGERNLVTLDCEKVQNNMLPILLEVLKLRCKSCRWYDMYTLITEDKSTVHYVIIKSTPETGFIFEKFRKLGILLSELKLAFNLTKDKLYLPRKLITETTAYSPEHIHSIIHYLRSILHLLYSSGYNYLNVRMSALGGLEVDNIEDIQRLLTTEIYDKEAIEILNIDTLDISEATFHTHRCMLLSPTSGGYSQNVKIIRETKVSAGKSHDEDMILLGAPKQSSYIILTRNTIYLSTKLSIMQLNPESKFRSIVNMYGTVNIRTVNLSKDSTFQVVDEQELASDSMTKMILEKLAKCNTPLVGEITTADIKDILGIECKGSKTDVDPLVIKELYKGDEYAENLYKQAQPYYDSFELGALGRTIKGFNNGHIYAMMFIGESGTGKSTAARVIPHRCGLPFICINFSVNIEEADLFGTMIPNPKKKNVDDPEFIWEDGVVTRAIRKGYTVILEEINFARPGVLGKLNSLLDESRQVALSSGEIVIAHERFRIIATCNIAYEGTNLFNKALINRFEIVHEFKQLSRAEMIKVVTERTKYPVGATLSIIMDVFEAIQKYSKEQNLNIVISLRQLFTIFNQGRYYTSAENAVMDIFINNGFIECPEYKDHFVSSILPAFKLGEITI